MLLSWPARSIAAPTRRCTLLRILQMGRRRLEDLRTFRARALGVKGF